MKHLVKEKDYFLAWLVFWLISTVAGAMIGAIAGGIIGFIMGIMNIDLQIIKLTGMVVGFLLGIPISYLTFRLIVAKMIVNAADKRFKEEQTISPIPQPVEPS